MGSFLFDRPARGRAGYWMCLAGGLATAGFAVSGPISHEVLKTTGRSSNEAPVPARGKLGQDLFLAIDHRDVNAVKQLLSQGANPNSLNGLEIRPLFIAAASYQMDVMQELLAAGASVDAKSVYGSPLTFAAASGNIAGAQMLLARGANPNTIRSDGVSTLMMASNSGNADLVSELIRRKANVNVEDDGGETALSFAARGGHLEVGKRLVAAGAKVDSVDAEGLTPLMVAAMTGHADFAKMLLASGAKPNAKNAAGQTALVLAAKYGDYPDVLSALIAGGANPKAKDTDGKMASSVVATRGYEASCEVLGQPLKATELRSVKASAELGLRRLQTSMRGFAQSATCISCHHEGLARVATAEGGARGFKIEADVQKVQMARLRGMAAGMKPFHQQALKSAEAMKQLPLVEMNEVASGYVWLMAGMAANHDPANEATGAMAMVLARQQSPDGAWRFSMPRPPMQSSFFTMTAFTVKSLQAYGPKKDQAELQERLGRAKQWVLTNPAPTVEDRASRLLALKWLGADASEIRTAVAALVKDQRLDGGWSQLPELHSDANATGQVLYALHIGGGLPTSDEIYQKGTRFLIRTQDADGSWFVAKRAVPSNNYVDAGFPHGESQYSSFNGSCWATIALLEAVKK